MDAEFWEWWVEGTLLSVSLSLTNPLHCLSPGTLPPPVTATPQGAVGARRSSGGPGSTSSPPPGGRRWAVVRRA